MSTGRSSLVLGLVLFGLAANTRADALDATRWRWSAWTPSMGVAPLRWGTVSAHPAPVLSQPAPAQTTPPAKLLNTVQPIPSPPETAPARATALSSPTFILPPARIQSTARPGAASPNTPAIPSVDAYINMSDSGFRQAGTLTTGTPAPWYVSPVAIQLYGGIPDAQERLDFSSTVLERVRSAFQRSGLNVSLTSDSSVSAAHTLSVVSNTRSPANPDAVGVTDVGRDGFTFLDKLGYSSSIDELQWAVAHNVAHELMHAFGVERHDDSHTAIDSAVSGWSALVSESTIFSPEAVRLLSTRNFRETPATSAYAAAQTVLNPAPVPEPGTVVAWLAALAVATAIHRARRS